MSKASIISAALQIVFNTPQSSCYVGNPPNKPRKSRARKLLLFSSKYLDRTEKNPNISVSLHNSTCCLPNLQYNDLPPCTSSNNFSVVENFYLLLSFLLGVSKTLESGWCQCIFFPSGFLDNVVFSWEETVSLPPGRKCPVTLPCCKIETVFQFTFHFLNTTSGNIILQKKPEQNQTNKQNQQQPKN